MAEENGSSQEKKDEESKVKLQLEVPADEVNTNLLKKSGKDEKRQNQSSSSGSGSYKSNGKGESSNPISKPFTLRAYTVFGLIVIVIGLFTAFFAFTWGMLIIAAGSITIALGLWGKV